MCDLLLQKLKSGEELSQGEYLYLIKHRTECAESLYKAAAEVRNKIYGRRVYIRGLIEFTNYCKNDCFYCGIRRGNSNAERYRLLPEEILTCAENGYALGFRTFVLQGGEDSYYSDALLCDIVGQIKAKYPDCAVTLSVGERSFESYKSCALRVRTDICFATKQPIKAIMKCCTRRR